MRGASHSPIAFQRFGPYVEVHRLRGSEVQGCAKGALVGGRAVFLRWAPRDGHAGTGPRREHEALDEIGALGTPAPLDLLTVGGRETSVTSWIEGWTVRERAPLDLERAAVELFEMLDRAHACGWVHGDVTPSNLMVDTNEQISLIDWDVATRVSERAPPGTLGYAPPEGWDPGYCAQPRNDVYAASVVLAELRLGRRLFNGDRAEILAQQRDPTRVLAEVIEFGGVWEEIAKWIMTGGVRATPASVCRPHRTRTRRIVQTAASAEVVAAARCIEAGASDGRVVRVKAPVYLSVGDYADAIAAVLRRHGLGPCVRLDQLTGSASSAHGDPGCTSRVDRARAEQVRAARASRELLDACPDVMVVATRSELAEIGDPEWWHDGASQQRARGRVLVQVDPGDGAAEPEALKDLIARACSTVLAPEPLPSGLVAIAMEAGVGECGRVADFLQALTRANAISVEVGGSLRVREDVWREARDQVVQELGLDINRGSSSACVRAETDSHLNPGSAELAVAWGERAAVAGRSEQVVRAAIRATTVIGREASSELRCRLADLWLDLGRAEAAESVLSTHRSEELSPNELARLGRAVLTLGRSSEAGQIGLRLRELANCPDHHLEAVRLIGVGILFDGSPQDARTAFAAGRRVRRSSTLATRLMFDMSHANVLRRAGRTPAARRLLRAVMRRAETSGSIRIALSAEANLLLTDERHGRFAADRWERLAAHARRWGLLALAAENEVRAAREWVQADDLQRADECLSRVKSLRVGGLRLSHHTVEAVSEIDDVVSDRLGRGVACVGNGCDGSEVMELHRALLRLERGEDPRWPAYEQSRLTRAVRLALREACSQTPSSLRIARLMKSLANGVELRHPLVAHAIRVIVQAQVRLDLAGALRCGEVSDECERALMEVVHLLQAAYGEALDRKTAWWVLTETSAEDSAHFPGVRAWEFHLSRAMAERAVGHLDDPLDRAMRVVRSIERTCGDVTASTLGPCLSGVRWERVGAIAGWDSDAVRGVRTAEDPIGMASRLLSGARAEDPDGVRRELGLRRVLRAALRLRATGTLDEVLGEVVLGVLDVCRAERALVLYDTGCGGPRAKLATIHGVEAIDPQAAEFSEAVLERVRTSNGVCLIDDAADDSELGVRPSVKRVGARSIMVGPLRTSTRHFGYLYVENRSLPRSFGAADRELIEGFAAQAALALENNQLVEELRSSNRDLAHARGEAVRAENLRALGRLAGEVAHDFNNLLTAILGESQLLMEDPRAAEVRDRLQVIERAALDGAATIRRIQESTRVRTADDFERIDLGQVVREVVDLTRVRWSSVRAEGAGAIDLTVDAPGGIFVRGVASELREVVTNVLVNAIDAMPNGGRLAVGARSAGDRAEVVVADSGCGMPPEVVARIFDPFYTTKGAKGNGLGLSIAHGIVGRHGGEILVESQPSVGTTMRIAIPACAADASGAGWVDRVRAAVSPVESGVRRALVVDDDPSVLRVVSEMLRGEGYVVETAAGGASAMVRLQGVGEPYSIVLTDLFMPDVNGLDVAAEVRRLGASRRTIVMSGCAMTLQGGALEGHSVDGVLRKPFSRDDLQKVVPKG